VSNPFEEGTDAAKEAIDLDAQGYEELKRSGGDIELKRSGGDIELSGDGEEGGDSGGDIESDPKDDGN
jgi:hypothetical protein